MLLMLNNFDNDVHALKAGMVIGKLMGLGVMVWPEIDDDGDYTDTIQMRLQLDQGEPPVDVRLKVLP